MLAFKVGNSEPAIIVRSMKDAQPAIWSTVEDVRLAFEELKQRGIHFLSERYEIMSGLAVEFFDPSGNKLGLTDYSKKLPFNQ